MRAGRRLTQDSELTRAGRRVRKARDPRRDDTFDGSTGRTGAKPSCKDSERANASYRLNATLSRQELLREPRQTLAVAVPVAVRLTLRPRPLTVGRILTKQPRTGVGTLSPCDCSPRVTTCRAVLHGVNLFKEATLWQSDQCPCRLCTHWRNFKTAWQWNYTARSTLTDCRHCVASLTALCSPMATTRELLHTTKQPDFVRTFDL